MTEGAGTSLIRPATPGDVPVILGLIRELADYERTVESVVATEADLASALFGDDAVPSCLLATWRLDDKALKALAAQ